MYGNEVNEVELIDIYHWRLHASLTCAIYKESEAVARELDRDVAVMIAVVSVGESVILLVCHPTSSSSTSIPKELT